MREYDFIYGSGKTVTFIIPEETAWTRDRNIVKVSLSDTSDKLRALVVLTNTAEHLSMEYSSPYSWLVLDISDLIRRVTRLKDEQTTINVEMTATDSGGNEHTVTLNDGMYVLEGRTVGGRRHGADTVIRYYSSMQATVEVFNGEYIEDFDILSATAAPNGRYYYMWTSGGEFLDPLNHDGVGGHEQFVAIKEMCEPPLAVWLRFKNTDGCERIIAARPASIKETAAGVQYPVDYHAVSIGSEMKLSVERTLAVTVPEVEYGEHLTDIALADAVEWSMEGGEWWPCVVKSVTYAADGGTHDMGIELLTNF